MRLTQQSFLFTGKRINRERSRIWNAWNCLASLNFKETNFRATGLKKTLKTKTLIYCNEKKKLIVIEMTTFCIV